MTYQEIDALALRFEGEFDHEKGPSPLDWARLFGDFVGHCVWPLATTADVVVIDEPPATILWHPEHKRVIVHRRNTKPWRR